jgi:hypothetical protein
VSFAPCDRVLLASAAFTRCSAVLTERWQACIRQVPLGRESCVCGWVQGVVRREHLFRGWLRLHAVRVANEVNERRVELDDMFKELAKRPPKQARRLLT